MENMGKSIMNLADAVITHNVVAMRAEPRSGSEQVSQAVLNDFCTRLEDSGEYTKIRTVDAYEGWVLNKHVAFIDKKMREALPLYAAPYVMLRICEPIVDAYYFNDASQTFTKFVVCNGIIMNCSENFR